MRHRLLSPCWPLLLALLVGGCSAAPIPQPSPSPPRTVDYTALEAAVEEQIRSGSVSLSTINAVVVSVGGETKIAHYRNGSRPGDALHVWSVTKSVASALIGIAIEERIISGLEATLLELLPRYSKDLTAQEEAITLRQLMSMTAGFPPDEPAPFENIHSVFRQRTDPVPMILTDGPELEPGQYFSYSSRSSHLVSAVLREALLRADPHHPRTVLQYAQEKLFDPLNTGSGGAQEGRVLLSDTAYDRLTRFDWGTDAAGLNSACCLLRLRPKDLVKLGELYLGGGVWHGRRVLPAGWVEQTMTPSELSPAYGLMWWLDIDPHGHAAWLAQGSGGQLVAVVPEHQLVVVVGSVPTADWDLGGTSLWTWLSGVVVPPIS